MKVAYLVNQYPKVSHSFIRREIAALERAGLEVQRYAMRGWSGELPDAADAAEQKRTRYLLREGAGPLIAAFCRAFIEQPRAMLNALKLALRLGWRADRPLPVHLIYLAQACRLNEWLRATGATHLHAHFGSNPAEVALLANALGGLPYSVTVHGPEEFDKPHALHLAEKVHGAAFVAAVSSFGRSQLYRWARPEDWPRIAVVHCGIDAAFGTTATTPVADVVRLVCVGRICEQKGQLLLVEAVARLLARGLALELVLAGDGEMRSSVEALIGRLAVGQHVRITGWIDGAAVRAELIAARALVLPSFAEGLPVVIMEAMALQRPVISTFVAGIPELVVHGSTGWLVPAGDIDALAEAIEACLSTPVAELARMGEAGRARVSERHDADREAAKLAARFTASASLFAPARERST